MMFALLWFVPVFWPLSIPTILTIVGGIYALERWEWPAALAGSISAFYTSVSFMVVSYIQARDIGGLWISVPLGITAVVLTILGRKEFEQLENELGVPVNRVWMPKAAGILGIISGAIQVGAAMHAIWIITSGKLGYDYMGKLYVYYTLPCLITGLIAIIGSINTIQRKKWNLALFGALAAFIPLGVLATAFLMYFPIITPLMLIGIVAIVLTAKSKIQFQQY